MSRPVKLTLAQRANRVTWVRHLLSGHYTQGTGRLWTLSAGDRAYCCLGVAGEALCQNALVADPYDEERSKHAYLPRSCARMLGFGDNSTEPGNLAGAAEGDQSVAGRWNDTRALDFVQIANRIAWATEHGLRLRDVKAVPPGYARNWLRGLDV